MSCCSSCHKVTDPECKLEKLLKATEKMEADTKEYEESLAELISVANEILESVPGWLTKQDEREKAMAGDVKQLCSEVRRIADDCEKNALSHVQETMSKHTLAAVEKIVSAFSKLTKGRQGLSLEQTAESCPNEGMSIQSGEEDVRGDSHAASRVSPTKSADYLNQRSVKLRQAIDQSKTLLNDFKNLSPIEYETILNKKVLDSVEIILKDSCEIICHKPIGQLVKDIYFTVEGCQQVMTNLDKSVKSDIIIATYSPNKLMVVTQSGKTTKPVALKNNYQPFGVCQLNGRIYVTHQYQNQIAVYQTSNLDYQTSFSVDGGCTGIGSLCDSLVVACCSDRCIRTITTSGGVIAQSTHTFAGNPWGLAITPNADAVVVSDHTADQVVVLSPDLGIHLRTIPCGGTNPGDVCVYGTNIYVCNITSDQVMELSLGGQSSRSVISVIRPAGICINAARMCFMVSNCHNGRIASYMARP